MMRPGLSLATAFTSTADITLSIEESVWFVRKSLVFVGTFTAGRLRVAVEDGRLRIMNDGDVVCRDHRVLPSRLGPREHAFVRRHDGLSIC
jgi:hypothetical protein